MTEDSIFELEHKAQRAGEARLRAGMDSVYDDDPDNPEYDSVTFQAPFCGCDTCIVREILDAAWPYLYKAAHHPDTAEPE